MFGYKAPPETSARQLITVRHGVTSQYSSKGRSFRESEVAREGYEGGNMGRN